MPTRQNYLEALSLKQTYVNSITEQLNNFRVEASRKLTITFLNISKIQLR